MFNFQEIEFNISAIKMLNDSLDLIQAHHKISIFSALFIRKAKVLHDLNKRFTIFPMISKNQIYLV
jgi:hypothetical protein